MEELKNETRTIILYEAPHHLKSTLKDLYEARETGISPSAES